MLSSILLVGSFLSLVASSPTPDINDNGVLEERQTTPTVYLAGDSTMARGGDGSGTGTTDGWGQFLHFSLTAPVVNNAIAGRSARSFTREGRFTSILNNVKAGDWVIIEFGHNDGGGSACSSTDNGRADVGGEGNESCQTTLAGVAETVHTFNFYLEQATRQFTAKGAHVVISSQTPNNPFETGAFSYAPSRFVPMAADSAAAVGTSYVDHGAYVADEFRRLGSATVTRFFPNDHTHTSPPGANVVSAAFVKGILCGNSAFKSLVRNSTATVAGACL